MVRLPLNQDCWLGDDGLPRFGNASGRAAVSRWVRTLNRAGIAVMLDLHWAGPDGVVADGLRVMADARSVDFWRSVARKFKGNRSVSFDVFNEPYTRYGDTGIVFDLTWECWLSGGCTATRAHLGQQPDGSTFATIGMQTLVDAVRATGPGSRSCSADAASAMTSAAGSPIARPTSSWSPPSTITTSSPAEPEPAGMRQ